MPALEAAQAELGELDRRIAACEQELELRDIARRRHQMQDRQAVIAGEPRPKLTLAPSEAETALPILRGERKALAEREADAPGRFRRACVEEVERRYGQA